MHPKKWMLGRLFGHPSSNFRCETVKFQEADVEQFHFVRADFPLCVFFHGRHGFFRHFRGLFEISPLNSFNSMDSFSVHYLFRNKD